MCLVILQQFQALHLYFDTQKLVNDTVKRNDIMIITVANIIVPTFCTTIHTMMVDKRDNWSTNG